MLGKLTLLRFRALRKGIWFKALSKVERFIYELTMRTVSTIRSEKLLSTIRLILKKLRRALGGSVYTSMCSLGRHLARRIANVAYLWGNKEAYKWAEDNHLIKYLTICCMNMPTYYRIQLCRYEVSANCRR